MVDGSTAERKPVEAGENNDSTIYELNKRNSPAHNKPLAGLFLRLEMTHF